MSKEQTTDWPARYAGAVAAEGDEWERLHLSHQLAWQAAYCDEFRRVAKSRGWTDENIESGWLDNMPADAFLVDAAASPEPIAGQDVIECEGLNDD